jgi:hypothetical protein
VNEGIKRRTGDHLLSPLEECSVLSQGLTALCAVIGAFALLGIFFLTVTGGSPYLQFGLALVFFAMFIVGSYWWMVFGPGRGQ